MTDPAIALAELREIGWSFWDPRELLELVDSTVVRFPDDEYDNYLWSAVKRFRAGADVEAVSAYLYRVATGEMGVKPSEKAYCAAYLTASEIHHLLNLDSIS